MQYQKLISGPTVIEFHNNWMGEETVVVNGRVVSKKSSVWGTNHYFTVMEEGHSSRYILTTKTDGLKVLLDLSRNGELLYEDVPVKYGSMPKKPQNKAKKLGLTRLQEYDVETALEELEKARKLAPDDPEVYFHLACAHSNLENTREGFACLQKAVELGLPDKEMILDHDMLAFLRMHPAFEEFLNSGFTQYDEQVL